MVLWVDGFVKVVGICGYYLVFLRYNVGKSTNTDY